MSNKNDKFKRLANKRVAKVKDEMRKIGNLSNKALYEYSPEEVDIICTALQEGLDSLRESFDRGNALKTSRLFE